MAELNGTPRYKKVMIIDDNEVDRYVAARNVKAYGFAEEVVVKESVNSAIEYLESLTSTTAEQPELIFLDIRMPSKDGFDFLEEYEKLHETMKKRCIIMMLSTSLNPDDYKRAKNNKYVSEFLNKPLDKEKLLQVEQLSAKMGLPQ